MREDTLSTRRVKMGAEDRSETAPSQEARALVAWVINRRQQYTRDRLALRTIEGELADCMSQTFDQWVRDG